MATATDNRVPADLLEILVCPVSHGALRQEGDYLVCEASDLAYPVRDGIPVMLVEEAVPYSSLRDGTGAGEDREAGAAEGAGA